MVSLEESKQRKSCIIFVNTFRVMKRTAIWFGCKKYIVICSWGVLKAEDCLEILGIDGGKIFNTTLEMRYDGVN